MQLILISPYSFWMVINNNNNNNNNDPGKGTNHKKQKKGGRRNYHRLASVLTLAVSLVVAVAVASTNKTAITASHDLTPK